MKRFVAPALAGLALALTATAVAGIAAPAPAEATDVAALLKKYDAIMAPAYFEATFSMTAHREDGSTRTYDLTAWKSADDKFRAYFNSPSSVKGQEILRVGDNSWVYMPKLRRAIRIASRDSFMGGDFNNADVLRPNYSADYTGTVSGTEGSLTRLDLKAKSGDVAYDKVKLWVNTADGMPAKAEFYTSSGKMLRKATFSDVRTWSDGHKRPAKIKMDNLLVPARWSIMETKAFKVVSSIPGTKFSVSALGK